MFKDKLNKLIGNDIENKSEQTTNNKKKIENLVFLVIVLIITIVVINYVWNGNKTSNKTYTNSQGKQLATVNSEKTVQVSSDSYSLEDRLENILKSINGVGDVKVFINYSESGETMAMYNENSKVSVTEETDKSGGQRKIETTDSQKEIIYQEENGDKLPIIQKTTEAKIEGAIITAKGAANINVKTNIIQAIEAATGLPTHKIQVFEMN